MEDLRILSTPVSLHDSSCTFLVKIGSGQVGLRWAGCLYGPADKISDVVSGELLAECEAKLADPATEWTPRVLVDGGELGPVLESDFT